MGKKTKATTERHKRAVQIIARKIQNDEPLIGKHILLEAGYSKTTANVPGRVLDSAGFRAYLSKIDDAPIIEKWMKWALDDSNRKIALQAGENILKLKDRFPAQKKQVIGFFENLTHLEKDEQDNEKN